MSADTRLTGRLQTRSPDEEAIDVGLLRQIAAVLLRHGAAVDNPRRLGRLLGRLLAEPLADGRVGFLCLLGSRLTGQLYPDGLLGIDV